MRFIATGMVTMLALSLPGCIEPDDAALIMAARKACSRLAKPQLQKLSGGQELELETVANTESDPEHNMFEFIWREKDITGNSLAADKKSIWCRGNAGAKIITQLSVGGETLITAPRTY